MFMHTHWPCSRQQQVCISTFYFSNSGRRFFPAQIISIADIPKHLQRRFSRISPGHALVQWITESKFSAVRRSRIHPLGKTDRDSEFASKSAEINWRYVQALDIMDRWSFVFFSFNQPIDGFYRLFAETLSNLYVILLSLISFFIEWISPRMIDQ